MMSATGCIEYIPFNGRFVSIQFGGGGGGRMFIPLKWKLRAALLQLRHEIRRIKCESL